MPEPTSKPTLSVADLLRGLPAVQQNWRDQAARADWTAHKDALLARLTNADPDTARRLGLPAD